MLLLSRISYAHKDKIYESFVNLDTDSLRRFLALEVGYGGSLHFRVSNFTKQGCGAFAMRI